MYHKLIKKNWYVQCNLSNPESGPCLIRNPVYNGYLILSDQLKILLFNLSNPDSSLNQPEILVPEGSG